MPCKTACFSMVLAVFLLTTSILAFSMSSLLIPVAIRAVLPIASLMVLSFSSDKVCSGASEVFAISGLLNSATVSSAGAPFEVASGWFSPVSVPAYSLMRSRASASERTSPWGFEFCVVSPDIFRPPFVQLMVATRLVLPIRLIPLAVMLLHPSFLDRFHENAAWCQQ